MKTSAPVHVDRLARALKDAGVDLRRSKVIEIAAAALGYHNSNEFQAAARRGDLTPPQADPVGDMSLADGTVLVVLRAPGGMPYAIARSTLEGDRSAAIGITPYGGMVTLPPVDGEILQPAPALTAGGVFHVAIVERDVDPVIGVGRVEIVMGRSRQECESALAGFCRDRWDQAHDRAGLVVGHLPLQYDGLDDAQVVETYFEATSDVLIDRRTVTVGDEPTLPAVQVIPEGMVMIGADALGTLVEAADAHAETLKEDQDDDMLSSEHRESSGTFVDQIEEALRTARGISTPTVAKDPAAPLEGSDFRIVHKDVLDELISAAESHSLDATTGVEDGIYDPAENEWVEALDEAIAAASLAREPRHEVAPRQNEAGEMLYAIVRTGSFDEVVLGADDAALDRGIADHCRKEWGSISGTPMGDVNPSLLPDDQVIEIFYGAHDADENSGYSFSRGSSPVSRQEAEKLQGTTVAWSDAVFHPRMDPAALAEMLRSSAEADIWADGTALRDPDAVVEVAEAKMAMRNAADILVEMVSGRRHAPSSPATGAQTTHGDEPLWLTDVEADVIYSVTRDQLENLGLDYDRGDGKNEWLPLTQDEYERLQPGARISGNAGDGKYIEIDGMEEVEIRLGQSCVLEGRKWIVPAVEFGFGEGERDGTYRRLEAYVRDLKPLVEAIGGSVRTYPDATDYAHSVDVFVPMETAMAFQGSDDLLAALKWLLCPADLRDRLVRVMASFETPTSSPGYDTRWDATFDVLLEGMAWAKSYLMGDRDEQMTMRLAESGLAHKDAWSLWNENWDLELDIDALKRLYSIR